MPVPITGPLWTKNFIILASANALLFSGFHLIMPVLPLFIADYGGTDSQVGLIMGSFTFSAVAVRLFTETGIASLGKIRFLLLGMLICLLGTAGYYWADTVGLAFAVRLLHGLGFGIATTLYATLAVDIIPAARRGEGLGYFGLGSTLSMAVSPALGVWLAADHGYGALFAAAATGQIIAILGMGAFSPAPAAGPGPAAPPTLLGRLMERKAAFPAFLCLMTGIAASGVIAFVALTAKEAHLTTVGYFFTVSTLFVFFSRLVVGRIFDRKGPAWVVLPGAVCLLIGQLILIRTGSTPVLLAAAVFHGLGIGTLLPSLQAWMVGLVPPDRRATVNATFYNFLDGGIGGGAILLGLVAQAAGYAAVYTVAAAVMGVFIAVYAVYLVRGRP
jgi:predicted MFS family arabinose efflux permease